MNKKIVVIGGDAAGLSAASKIKREKPEYEVTVFEKKDYISYSLCSLPYFLTGEIKDLKDIIHYTPENFSKKRGIDVKTGCTVVNVELPLKEVVYRQGGEVKRVKYDRLVIASGAEYIKFNEKTRFFVPTPEDYVEAGKLIREGKIKKSVVIGGGFAGIETAFELSKKKIKVTLLEAADHILPGMSEELSHDLRALLEKRDIEVLEGTRYVEGSGETGKVKTSGGTIDADTIFFCLGVKPNTDFIDIKKEKNGAIITNSMGETEIDSVYAGGDCATYISNIDNKKVYYPIGTYANRIGRVIGNKIAQQLETGFKINETQLLKLDGFEGGRAGRIDERDLKVKIDFKNAPTISGNDGKMHTILCCAHEGILKGGEVWGSGDAARRVNLISSYIGRPVKDLYKADIPYTPKISSVWDGVTIAANELLKNLK